jgi:deazaflavin-dependent oxidoreductase (nitroreductase family)
MDHTLPVRRIAASIALALLATSITLLVVLRRRVPPRAGEASAVPPSEAPDWVRRFVSARFNPLVERLGLVGGRRSPWAYVEHVGRTSGRAYRTPVLPAIAGDHAYIPLPYGADVQWARNVRAAGHCRLQVHERTYDLDEPRVITAAERHDLPERLRAWAEARGNRYLALHVLAERDGLLAVAAGAPTMADAGPAEAVAG